MLWYNLDEYEKNRIIELMKQMEIALDFECGELWDVAYRMCNSEDSDNVEDDEVLAEAKDIWKDWIETRYVPVEMIELFKNSPVKD
jgi:hypothetical protein